MPAYHLPREQTAVGDGIVDFLANHRGLPLAGGGGEQLCGLGEALEPDLADAIELQPVHTGGDFHDRTRDEYLAAAGARDDPGGLVDLAPVVVAVAIQRLA